MAQDVSEKDLLRHLPQARRLDVSDVYGRREERDCVAYSGTQGFKLLLRLRSRAQPEKKMPAKASSAWMDDIAKAVADAGKKVKAKARA